MTTKDIIIKFLNRYVDENGGLKSCRHGGCFELVEAFLDEFPTAEMWETWEYYGSLTNLPLVPSYEKIIEMCEGLPLCDMGGLGGHCVVKFEEHVFDAAGISSFEEISKYFNSLNAHVWVRTQ